MPEPAGLRVNPILDLSHLHGFTDGDWKLACEVLQTFRNHAHTYLDSLHNATSDRERRDQAHGLKGAAKAVGADRLAQLSGQVEAPISRCPCHSETLLKNVVDVFDEVAAEIDRLLLESEPPPSFTAAA